MTDHMAAWKISEKDFPESGSAADKLAFFVRYAVLAPSPYNTQPWQFVINGNTLSLYADRRYGLAVTDPDDRGLEIACGAALFSLRLAIRAFGYTGTTELLPDPEDEDLLARVKLGDKTEAAKEAEDQSLFKAVTKRHMNWGAFAAKEVPETILKDLKAAAAREGAWLHICTPHERTDIVRMVTEADHIQTSDKNFRRELMSWIHPLRAQSGDGIPTDTARYSKIMGSFSPHLLRRFEGDHNKAANDDQLEEGSPVIAVLGSKSGGTLQRLHAGQALMHVLLCAEGFGLSSSPLNQPCEVPELRLRLHDALEQQGRAQYILRLGYGGKPTYAPRRALSEVLKCEGKPPVVLDVGVSSRGQGGVVGRFRNMWRGK